jgi:hypothetical protein
MRSDGTNPQRLVDYKGTSYDGVDFTPDGKFIIFAALAGDHMQLFSFPRPAFAPAASAAPATASPAPTGSAASPASGATVAPVGSPAASAATPAPPDASASSSSAASAPPAPPAAAPEAPPQPVQITNDSGNLFHPRVSPDGHWIAATRLVQSKQIFRHPLP